MSHLRFDPDPRLLRGGVLALAIVAMVASATSTQPHAGSAGSGAVDQTGNNVIV